MYIWLSKIKRKNCWKKEKQENLANEIGITKTTLNYKLNNKIAFKQSEIIVLSNLLDIPRDEIIEYFFTLKV